MVGGNTDSNETERTASVEMLDLSTWIWRRVKSLPEPTAELSCCVLTWKTIGDDITKQVRAWDHQPQAEAAEESERMEID